jgi:hypothetical protein
MLNFVLDPELEKPDFRQTRIKRLIFHLVGLLELLDSTPIEPYLIQARDKWRATA